MKTVTVRDLRNNFSKLEAWLEEGEKIQIEKRGQPIAILTAIHKRTYSHKKKPDFHARLKAIWGDRVFNQSEVDSMRTAEFEGEEG